VCNAPNKDEIEPTCIADGFGCESSEECCQYSDPLSYASVRQCNKGIDLSTGNEDARGICQARSVDNIAFTPFCLAWNAGTFQGVNFDTFALGFGKPFPPVSRYITSSLSSHPSPLAPPPFDICVFLPFLLLIVCAVNLKSWR